MKMATPDTRIIWTVGILLVVLLVNERQARSIADEHEHEHRREHTTETAIEAGDNDPRGGGAALLDFHRRQRERNKEFRLNWIKYQILNSLGRNGLEGNTSLAIPGHTQEQMVELYEKVTSKIDDTEYTEKLQSFYASCDMPRNTDEDLWNTGDTMNLHFELTLPTAMTGNAIAIVAARLRLYKLSQGNVTESGTNDECVPGQEGRIQKSAENTAGHQQHHHQHQQQQHQQQHQPPVDGQQIRVSVYWYTRSLKKNKIRKKLMDSQMVSAYGDMWTEWNVLSAIRAWKESGKNFGIAVEVEDEDRVLLPANKYFTPMNCSKEASTSRPIPGYFVDAVRDDSNNKSWDLDWEQLPMIDLCTKEIPEADAADENPQQNQQHQMLLNNSEQSAEHSSSAQDNRREHQLDAHEQEAAHRVRHHYHHHHHGHHNHHHHLPSSTTTERPDSEIAVSRMHNNNSHNFKR